jgi:hypothetical protein
VLEFIRVELPDKTVDLVADEDVGAGQLHTPEVPPRAAAEPACDGAELAQPGVPLLDARPNPADWCL